MKINAETTQLLFELSMIKSAQLQEQLALKLIQTATQSVTPLQTPVESNLSGKSDVVATDQQIDIKV